MSRSWNIHQSINGDNNKYAISLPYIPFQINLIFRQFEILACPQRTMGDNDSLKALFSLTTLSQISQK